MSLDVASSSAFTRTSLPHPRTPWTAPSLPHGYAGVGSSVLRAAPTPALHCPSSRRLVAPGPRPGLALPVVSLPGERRVSPVPPSTFPPFHVPYAAGFFRAALQARHPFHGLRRSVPGSAPRCSLLAEGVLFDAADFTSCCGLVVCSPSYRGLSPALHRSGLPLRWRRCYKGGLVPPLAGLPPAS